MMDVCGGNMQYLYHYTSLETLALILANKSICFNNLLNVDDMEESETQDMGNFGRFLYVSCWTSEEQESIPLWNLYTPNMHGVRIKLPIFPFKKYSYKKGELFFKEDVETYINMEKIYDEDKVNIAANQPMLIEVDYTNEKDRLFPKVRKLSSVDELERYLNAGDMKEVEGVKVSYSFAELGKYKRMEWSFQKEWRYIFSIMPMGVKELNPPTFQKHQEIIRRMEDKEYIPPYSRMFLDIDDSALQNIEVLCGPKMSQAEKILVQALLNQYCPNGKYQESKLRIR